MTLRYKSIIKYFPILLGFWLMSCQPAPKDNAKDSIMVFAAASLTNVMAEMIDSFNITHAIKVKTNFTSSGTLARQIEQGGSADIYLSANTKWSNYIDSLGYFIKDYKSNIAENTLVLIASIDSDLNPVSIDSTLNLSALLQNERLSIGDPKHVPAGRYAKQAITYLGQYEQLQPQLLPAKDVRSALMVVEMSEAPLGIVYATDAQKSKKVKIIGTFPEQSHQPVIYAGGVITSYSIHYTKLYDTIKADLTSLAGKS